jgi:hypothetical protein
VYVPEGDSIKLEVLRECYDAKFAGHLGRDKTLELVSRNYCWPGMRRFVKEYVQTCETCVWNKTSRHTPYGELHPFPIPARPWQSVSIDFIMELPPSSGYNAIFVYIDRLTKMVHFIPTTTEVTAEDTATLYCRDVWCLHGLPVNIVSDHGSQFLSKFTQCLLEILDVKGNRSTSHHPQSDSQMEWVNQTLEQYLRVYCDHQQDDWYLLLQRLCCRWLNSSTTTCKTPQPSCHPSSPTTAITQGVPLLLSKNLSTPAPKTSPNDCRKRTEISRLI